MDDDLGRWADPSLLVMTSLAAGPKHGYAIMQDVASESGIRLGPGTLYGVIARLEERGLIEPLAAQDRRRPYKITAEGSRALAAQLQRMRSLAETGLGRLETGLGRLASTRLGRLDGGAASERRAVSPLERLRARAWFTRAAVKAELSGGTPYRPGTPQASVGGTALDPRRWRGPLSVGVESAGLRIRKA